MALESRGLLASADSKRLDVTPAGAVWFAAALGIDLCRCLDWTERHHHLAGPLGTRLLQRCCDLEWLARVPQSRAIRLTELGRGRWREELNMVL